VRILQASSSDDFGVFRALADEYEESLPHALRHAAWPQERLDVENCYAPPHAVFLAESRERAVGCVVLAANDDESVIVKKLYVTPEARASGGGRALMNALIDEARRRGCARVLLDTHAGELPAAYRLYLSLGFQEREAYAPVDYGCATFMELTL
jgi:GNAT superfamily N-acetyltransferase